MTKPDFVYTTYIRTTPQKLWDAIIKPEFTRQYWGHDNVSDWMPGSEWKHVNTQDGHAIVAGKVVESVPPTRLVLTWAHTNDPADGSRVSFEIEAIGDMTRLTVVHGGFVPNSTMADRLAVGWPRVLSSLKTLLESGKALDTWAGHQRECA